MALCLMPFIAACSSNPVIIAPPAHLLADCAHAPNPTEQSNGALAEYIQAEQKALDLCNADKAALREFFRD